MDMCQDVVRPVSCVLKSKPKILTHDPQSETGDGAEEQNRDHDWRIAWDLDESKDPGEQHQHRSEASEDKRDRSAIQKQLNRNVGEIEDAVDRVANSLAQAPGALAFDAGTPFVRHINAPVAQPEQKCD